MTAAPSAAARSGFLRSIWLRYVSFSIALLVPCFWQARIQAGDLSSHIYNAWLAQLIERGQAGGLTIVGQSTNILFDLLLSGLYRAVGPDWAQRAAVSCAVLIFVWGAFAFIAQAAGRRVWHLLPAIAMLAYGWVFHMGFFNFYLSLGLCFCALALAWTPTPLRIAMAALLLLPAYAAHALPVAWAIALIVYVSVARRISPPARLRLLAVSLLIVVAVGFAIRWGMLSEWSPRQLMLATGADQLWVFDGKYDLFLIGLLALWGTLFLDLIRSRGAREVISTVPFQLSVLSAAGIVLIPSTVALPGYHHALAFIGERMSLAAGICVCALMGTAPPQTWQRYAPLALSAIFFAVLFRDERALNRFEDRMDEIVSRVPAGQRVVSPIVDPGLRVNALAHMVDRACLGRCFSYANYEPSTAQFRIRAVAANPLVAEQYNDAWELQTGRHLVKDTELPLFRIAVGDSGQLAIESLKARVLCRGTLWEVLENRIPSS